MIDRTLCNMPWRISPSLLRTTTTALHLLTLVVMVSGCSPKAPTMRVNSTRIENVSVALGLPPNISAVMRVYVYGENQNSFDIQIRGVRGEVLLMGRHRLQISTQVGKWLAADRTTPFDFTVAIPIPVGLAILQDSLTMSCIPYTLQGVADVTATSTLKLDKDNYPFSQYGCIPRNALLTAIPGGR